MDHAFLNDFANDSIALNKLGGVRGGFVWSPNLIRQWRCILLSALAVIVSCEASRVIVIVNRAVVFWMGVVGL